MDALLAFNKKITSLPLAAGGVTLPASATAGARALTPVNVTAQLSSLSPAEFAALQLQVDAGEVDFQWTLFPAFATPGLSVGRRSIGYAATAQVPVLYLDVTNGNDANDGFSAGTALKTFAGLYAILPTVSLNGNKPIINLAANGSAQATYPVRTIFALGGETLVPGLRIRGGEMILAAPATGPATAALDVAPVTELSVANAYGISVPCRTQLNFVTAAPGWTVDDFAGRYHVRIKRGGNKQYFELPIARNTANTIIVDTLLYTGLGIVASISNAGVVTGLTGMSAGDVGAKLVLIGAATTGNNGAFTITAFNSATSVTVTAGGVTDANNGKLQWFKLPTDRILATDTVEICRPGAVLAGVVDGYNPLGQICIGGAASAIPDAATQNPNMGHAFERVEFSGPPFSSTQMARDFDRCRFSSSNAIGVHQGGQLSFSNCAGRSGQLRIGQVSTSVSPAGSRPGGVTATLAVALTAGAVTATVDSTAGFAASGTIQCESEAMTYTVASGTTFTIVRGVNGTSAAAHVAGTFLFPVTDPVNALPQVSLTAFASQFNTSAPAPIKTSGGFVYTVSRPLSFWQSSGSSNGVAPLQPVGSCSTLVQARGVAILGDCLSGTRQFLRPREGAQVVVDPAQFFGTGVGGVGDIAVETGAGVALGAGVGQFMEVNGVNGVLMNLESVVKKAITQAAADLVNITTATGGGPPLKSLKSLNVTAGAAGFLGTYTLTDAAGTMISAGGNAAVGVARISDDGKTITFPAGTQMTAMTLAYVPTTPTGDCSRVGSVLNNS